MITKAEFKNFIDLTSTAYDNAIDLIVAGVNKFVEGYCQNKLQAGEVTEYFNGDDIIEEGDQIFLNNRVNLLGVAVYYNSGTEGTPVWVAEDRDNYALLSNEGIIKLNFTRENLGVQSGYNNYKVVYTAGYVVANAPADLKLACLKLASAVYNKRKSEGESSEGLDGANVNFATALTDEVKAMLAPYKSKNL